MEINNSVAAWSAGLAAQRLPRWDELPDIDLYLDQVLTLLDKYLGLFCLKRVMASDSQHDQ